MKKNAFIFFFALFLCGLFPAQKIGVVDTEYILAKLPQYKDAEQRLQSQIKSWEEEVQKLQSEYETKRSAFENEKVLLVGNQLKEREKEIQDLEKKVKTFIDKKFGTDGEINSLRSSLTKPFQDQIWNAIKTVSTKNTLGIVIDKTNSASVLFLDNKYDYTDKVLDVLLKKEETKTKPKTTKKK
ncbi:MAG: OmpH family outer membrane protein [Bergeyella zoohelcum]|nr:OmpH family outer membrane protein [Bergeyella zoohelcum]